MPMIPISYIREHLEILDGLEDLKLRRLRDDAIDMVEHDVNRIIKKRQIRLVQTGFSNGIQPLKTPLISIDRIAFLNTDNVMEDVPSDSYVVTGPIWHKSGAINGGTDYFMYPEVELERNSCWPSSVSEKKNSVFVEYTAGFEQGELPSGLVRGILIAIATLYENRESLSPVQLFTVPAYECAIGQYRKIVQ